VGAAGFKKRDQSLDGLAIIRTALINKQKFMVIFFDPVFHDTLKLITDALENEVHIWKDFDTHLASSCSSGPSRSPQSEARATRQRHGQTCRGVEHCSTSAV
jgi:hypothetical protein